MNYSNEPCSGCDQIVETFHFKFTRIVEGKDFQYGIFSFTHHLPGNNVGMMFHRRQNDLIARTNAHSSACLREEVEAFGYIA